MINLLPPQQKEALLHEKTYKLCLIFGVLSLFFLIALSLALFAVKVYISGKIQSGEILIPPQFQVQEREIIKANKDVQNLNYFYENQPDFAAILEKISLTLPSGVSLGSISLNPSKEGGFLLVSLQGLSPTREILFQLKRNLESDKIFQDIDFPISNLVRRENIEFSITLKVGPGL